MRKVLGLPAIQVGSAHACTCFCVCCEHVHVDSSSVAFSNLQQDWSTTNIHLKLDQARLGYTVFFIVVPHLKDRSMSSTTVSLCQPPEDWMA